MPIRRYLEDHASFDPEQIEVMSHALEGACKALHVNGEIKDREAVAARIVDLARSGVLDAKALSRRVVAEIRALRSL